MLNTVSPRGQFRFTVMLVSAGWLMAPACVAPAWIRAEAQSMQPQSAAPLPQPAPMQALPPSAPPQVIQAQPVPSQPKPQNAAPPPEAEANPGLIEEFGRILKNSASGLSSTLKGSQETLDGINSTAQGAAKGAADALWSTAGQTMVKGRAICPVASNGAPDCKAASEQLCKSKGYRTGSSVDIETSETCDPKIYLSGRTGAPGECKTQNSVTRAVCQ